MEFNIPSSVCLRILVQFVSNKIWMFLLCIVGNLSIVFAQSQNEFQQAFDSFRNQAYQEYKDFRLQANEEYVQFMRQAWVKYQKLPSMKFPDINPPLPPVIINEEDLNKPIEEDQIPIDETIVPDLEPNPQPKPIAPIRDVPYPTEETFEFVFMGTLEHIRINDEHRITVPKCEENVIADAWSAMCNERYNNVIRDCLLIRLEQNLCDWAYFEMLCCFGDAFYGRGTNESILLTAFIYCQSGYSMRLANTEGHLEMLFASKHYIYALPYFDIDGELFYSANQSNADSYLMPFGFPGEQPMSLLVGQEQKFALDLTPQRVLQSERYPTIKINLCTNQNLINFYSTYPTSQIGEDFMTRWAMYANAPLCETTATQLYNTLNQYIWGCNQLEAVNRLLNWVQTAFVYEYDDKIWGGDRAFFAEETLCYPYCDCEDRSILFSRLVRDLLGLEIVLVYYPGHLATAVGFTEAVRGDYIIVDGKRYVIADPTYIGAPVGYTMPDMDNKSAKAIVLK